MKRLPFTFCFLIVCSAIHGAWESNGTSDYGTIPYHTDFDFKGAGQSFTISCWISVADLTHDGGIFGRWYLGDYYQYVLKFESDNNSIKFAVEDTGGSQIAESAVNSIPQDTWTHVMGVADAGTLRIYINGSASGNTDAYGTIEDVGATTGPLVGVENLYIPPAAKYFEGQILDLSVWDTNLGASYRALVSGSKIARMALQADVANLVEHWPFDDGAHGASAVSELGRGYVAGHNVMFNGGTWRGGPLTYAYWLPRVVRQVVAMDSAPIRRRWR